MVYIWFRFDFKFAPGATVAMMHDLMIMCGFYVITQHEFNIVSIAALLTVAGYSVNDTIVIYDRVRTLFAHGGDGQSLPLTINRAINLTLSRTLLTSISTLAVLVPIALVCTGPIQDFAIAVSIGVLVGTYSTYYVASPMTVVVQKYTEKEKGSGGSRRRAASAT